MNLDESLFMISHKLKIAILVLSELKVYLCFFQLKLVFYSAEGFNIFRTSLWDEFVTTIM